MWFFLHILHVKSLETRAVKRTRTQTLKSRELQAVVLRHSDETVAHKRSDSRFGGSGFRAKRFVVGGCRCKGARSSPQSAIITPLESTRATPYAARHSLLQRPGSLS